MYGLILKDEWKKLYTNISPVILHAAILNDLLRRLSNHRYNIFMYREFIDRGASMNTQDF